MRKVFVFLTIFSLIFSYSPFAFAQEISPSATLTDTPTPTTVPQEDPVVEAINQIYQISSPSASTSIDTDTTSEGPYPSFSGAESQFSANFVSPPIIRTLSKRSFRANENVEVNIDNADNNKIEVSITDGNGEEADFDYFIIDNGSTKIVRVKTNRHFKPGKYTITVKDGSQSYSQDFTWGVLAINTNKSIYAPNETAGIAIAVLDETGEMVCDADVKLEITNPSSEKNILSTDNGKIKVNESCTKKEVTVTPDYEANYAVSSQGVYNLNLLATTDNGNYSITDSFEVRDSVPFDVERITATRIFPVYPYPVDIIITANEDFEGTVSEVVPASFVITQSSLSNIPFTEEAASQTSLETLLSSESAKLGLPFEGEFPISQEFGEKILKDPQEQNLYTKFNLAGHDGVDFDVPQDTPILAAYGGKVSLAGYGAYGLTIVIDSDWGRSYYGHLSKSNVRVGQNVSKGQQIGLSGNTGLSTGPHLHFGMKPKNPDMENGYYGKIDPLPFLGIASYQDNTLKILSWKISVKKGDKINLGYFYKAPNISPQFYKLGPLRFTESSGSRIFEETRQWQIAVDADGSGANTVSPTTGSISATGQTYTFTFDPSETMDSGGITIQEPSANDWTVPQGTSGTAGYTTAAGTGNATVGDVLINADVEDPTSPAGIWQEIDADMCGSTSLNAAADIVVDTTNKKEGTGSIQCADPAGAPDNNDDWGFVYDTSQNWETFCGGGDCQQISWWQRAVVATEAFEFDVSSTTDISTGITGAICTGSVTTANTWEYRTCDISTATLTTVKAFGFSCTNNTCNPFETDVFNVDEFLIGPGTPTFSGSSPWVMTVRFLDLAATDTVTVTYGSGGGSSGVTNSATAGVHTFTTASKITVDGTYTNLSGGSPTVTLSSGPTNEQLMRHGNWFNSGVEQGFTF